MKLTYQSSENIQIPLSEQRLLLEGRENGQYQALNSIDLVFETVHPADKLQNFIVSYFTPTSSSNMVLSYEEASREIYSRGLHHHDYFEMVYIIRGEMYQIIENKRHLYTEGSLCLLNKNIRHTEEYASDFRAAFLSLPVPLIESIINDSETFLFPSEKTDDNQQLFSFFSNNMATGTAAIREYIDFIPRSNDESVNHKMYALFEELTLVFMAPSAGASYQVKNILMQIFSEILNDTNYQTRPVNIGTKKEGEIFDRLTNLMVERHGRISRKELAASLNYSGVYLNNITRKYTGLNLFQYSMTICMKEAAARLRDTDEKISDISESLGFNNRTHFYKIFKDTYHMTPKAYRRIMLKGASSGLN
jgi:AraC-like DNA-binding protein